jgi:hypothetical protein
MKKFLIPIILIMSLAFIGCEEETSSNLCEGVTCNAANAYCDVNTSYCNCDIGFSGDATDLNGTGCVFDGTSLCDNIVCNSVNASCNETNGFCECDMGYTADATGDCILDATGLCDNVTCTDLNSTCNPATGNCDCNIGYTADATGDCMLDSTLCDTVTCNATNASCNPVDGFCECDEFYYGDATDLVGTGCATTLCDTTTCATNATCNLADGFCECDSGYTIGDATTTGCLEATDLLSQLYIWESDADQAGGADTGEFVEIWNNTGGDVDLGVDKYFLVFIMGNSALSYSCVELTGTVLDDDVVVVGKAAVPNYDILMVDKMKDGADGVVLVQCADCTCADIPVDTDITVNQTFDASGNQAFKIDGLAYDTSDADKAVLMSVCGVTTQWDEDMNGNKDTESLQRTNASTWTAGTPTPGVK